MEGSPVGPFQALPERLPVGMSHALHIFGYRMLDALVPEGMGIVDGCLTGISRCPSSTFCLVKGCRVFLPVASTTSARTSLGPPVPDSDHCNLGSYSPSGFEPGLTPATAHVLSSASEASPIDFERAAELELDIAKGFPDPMGKMPRRLLGDVQIPVKLHAGYRFQ